MAKLSAETQAIVDRAVAKALAKFAPQKAARTAAVEREKHWTPFSDAQDAIKMATSERIPLPTPTAEQREKAGGGFFGYVRAARAIQRGENT